MKGVSAKISRLKNNRGLGTFLASEAAKGMDKFVPMRTGALASSAKVSPFKVRYTMPYARRAYEGSNLRFSHDKHPNATAYWDRAYTASGVPELAGAA